MSTKVIRAVLCLSSVATILACQLASKIVAGDPTDTPIATATTEEPLDLEATAQAEATREAQATADVQGTTNAQALAATEAQETQLAMDKQATATHEAEIKSSATAKVQQQATAQAQVMIQTIERLQKEGVINTTEGEYARVEDFDESWAQLGWYRWWETDYSMEDFVVAAYVMWNTASDKSNWPETGCGFVFAESDNDNHNLAYLALDGYVRLSHQRKGNWKTLASRKYGKVSIPEGEAQIMLVVFDKHITFYVNQTQVASAYDGLLAPGDLNYTLLSGTNKDYGTRCQMTNVDLWIIK